MPYFTRVWNDFREFTWFCSWRGTSELVMESLSPCVILDLTPIWYGMDHPVVLSDCFSRWSTDHGALESMFFIHGSWWWPRLGVRCEEYYFPCNINLEWFRLVQFWPHGIIWTLCKFGKIACHSFLGEFFPMDFSAWWEGRQKMPPALLSLLIPPVT